MALLVHLALEHGQRHTRAALASLLWPHLAADKGRNNLRLTSFKLREAIGAAPWFHSARDALSVDVGRGPDQLSVDVLDLLARTLPLDRTGPFPDLAPDGCAAYEEWQAVWQEQVRVSTVGQLEVAAREALRTGEPRRAEQWGRQLVAVDPLVEAGHELVLRALLAQDREVEAQHELEASRGLLAEELGLQPGSVLEGVLAEPAGRGGGVPDGPAARELDPAHPLSPLALPVSATTFYGRTQEIQQLTDTIRARGNRLLTVVGPGGMGKTRLCVEVASANANAFEEGAAFVALAGLSRVTQVPLAIATALGMSGVAAAADPVNALVERLRDREVLLVVDNAEHLLGRSDGLSSLLATLVKACPHVVCLVSSRQALRMTAEDVTHLGGLAHPAEVEVGLAGYDAVRLLVDRLHRVDKRIRLDDTTAPDIVEICALVEGMPLGLELAASATRQRPLSEVARALRDAPASVTNDVVDRNPRHGDLGAVYQQSVALLAEPDRRVLERLAVFRGGFCADAAAAVTGADPATLARLRSATLVERTDDGRYRIHELIRQLAEDALEATEGADEVRDRHAEHYLTALAEAAPRLNQAGASVVLAELERDGSNHRTAWLRALETERCDLLLAASAGLVSWVMSSGTFPDALELITAAKDLMVDTDDRAHMVLRVGTLTSDRMRTTDPLAAVLREGFELAGDEPGRAWLRAKLHLQWGSIVNEVDGALDEAAAALDRTATEAACTDDPVVNAFMQLRFGYVALDRARFSDAAARAHEALDGFRAAGHVRGEAQALTAMAHIHHERYDLWPALDAVTRAAERFADMGHAASLAMVKELQGQVLNRLGAFDRAAVLLEESLAGQARHAPDTNPGETRVALGEALAGLGDVVAAEKAFAEGLEAMALGGVANMLRFWLVPWGRFLLRRDRPLEAELVAEEIVELNDALDAAPMVATGRAMLAHAMLAGGMAEEALGEVRAVWDVVRVDVDRLLDPLGTLLDCHTVFAAAGRPDDAAKAAALARKVMKRVARSITDPAMRADYLNRVPACRAIAALPRG